MSTMDGSTAVIEAPVTFKAYLMCAFASFGGIFFGYDSGYINGTSFGFATLTRARLVVVVVPDPR